MWCFCRKRSSIIEDEQSEEFIRISYNNGVEKGTDDHKSNIIADLVVEEKHHGKKETPKKRCEIYDKNKEYENSEIISKLVSEPDTEKQNLANSNDASSSGVIEEAGMKMHKVEVHSRQNLDKHVKGTDKIDKLKRECNDAVTYQESGGSPENSLSSHYTQTENGVLPAPLMKRREKTKSSDLSDGQLQSKNLPLDLSQKCVLNVKESGDSLNILPRQIIQKNVSNKLFYENLPPGMENTEKDPPMPLDLSLGSSGQKEGRESKCSNLINLQLELSPLNLSKKNYVSTDAASPSSFGISYNGELSPSSMETNNTQCFSTNSSRPDLLSNVDNDDYKLIDHTKNSYFNAVYDKSSLGSSNPRFVQILSRQSPDVGRIRVLSPPSMRHVIHYNSESVEITRPKIAHSGSYVHSSISSQHWQLQAQDHSSDRIKETSLQFSSSNVSLSRPPVFPHPIPAHCRPNRDVPNSNSLHSISSHSMKNSFYNPSYQNHTLDGDAAYAVLDDVNKKPLYDNLKPNEEDIYEIYDDGGKVAADKGPLYANTSLTTENVYFAYDNNTYIPPHRLKNRENTYENDASASQVDHTYSTIGSPNNIDLQSPKTLPPMESTSKDDCENEERSQNKPLDSNCSKSQLTCSDSVPVALNLVKVPDIPLPVKVKPSSGRNFMKSNKNSGCNGGKHKLNNGNNKSNNKFGYKSRGKIGEITLVESSGSILDELLSPSGSKQAPQLLPKNKKPSLTSLTSHQQQNSEKVGPTLEACGKKFSSLSDMKKNSASPLSASSTPKSKASKSGRSLLSSFSFRGDKKQPVPKSESSRLLEGKNKWNNSSAASLGSIASLASSSSSLSNYVHPPSIASEGGLLSNCRDDFDCGILIPPIYSTPPCLAANVNDSVLEENFKLLRECPWYWGPLDVRGAEEMLLGKQDGSFLVRDSSDEGCIVSLTFRSLQMTHHTRIEYKNGTLSFHIPFPRSPGAPSSTLAAPPPPSSPNAKGSTIVEFLIRAMEDSVQNCNDPPAGNACWLYLERSGPNGTSRVPVKLFTPIGKRTTGRDRISSLKSLSRKAVAGFINKESIGLLPLSRWLKAYLLIEFI